MVEHGVSGVAVVDDAGVLQGNISVSDLRGLAAADLGSLLLPVGRFLKVPRPKPISHQTDAAPYLREPRALDYNQERVKQEAPVMCSTETTFETAIHRLAHHRVHRLWCTVRDV
jgi:CBS domain-containing protein